MEVTDFDFYRLNPGKVDLDPEVEHHHPEEDTRREVDSPEYLKKPQFNQREMAETAREL